MSSAIPLTEPTHNETRSRFRASAKAHVVALLMVWAISACYMSTHFKRGWVPHDEGTLGQSAERVLLGQMPHRDFDDYTGGLTYVHALMFRLLGINSGSMRVVLFIFFLGWVPAVYYIAARFGEWYSAAAIALLAVAWSVPNYPGPMPSWYNLYFATFGLAALLHYAEVNSRRWLFVAGICAGLSFLAKITAAYFVCGALLFFIFREQSLALGERCNSRARARLYSAFIALGLGTFLVLLARMIHKVPGAGDLIYFVFPAFVLVVLLLAREFSGIPGKDRMRFVALARMCVPFAIGVLIPLMVFVVPYMIAGSVRDLMIGIIVVPARAVQFASQMPAEPAMMMTAIPFLLPIILAYDTKKLGRVVWGIVLALFCCAVFIFSVPVPLVYDFGWCSMALALPLLVAAGVTFLWAPSVKQKLTTLRQQQIMMLMSVAALCSIVQFPFATPVYFFFAAPLIILLACALFSSNSRPPKLVLGVLCGFYLLFVVLRVTPGFVYHMGFQYAPDEQTETLAIARAGGLKVEPKDARLYDELIPLLHDHESGRFIYAAPDCPEVYFLSGFRSPSRHNFEYAEDSFQHTERTLSMLRQLGVNVIAIDKHPDFSPGTALDLQNALERDYPQFKDLGKFQVRWRQ